MTASITDFSQFSALRRGAENNDPEVLREVAGQFEALFIQSMLKSMRETSLGDPIFGQSEQHEMYQEMLDKQYALEMSGGRGIGLSDMLVRQLGGTSPSPPQTEVVEMRLPPASVMKPVRASPADAPHLEDVEMKEATAEAAKPAWTRPAEFVRDIWPHAQAAASKLKVTPEGLLAQAALETGWGKHVMQRPDGASSYNLFGIKASGSWDGPTATRPTLEFRNGVSERQIARFRAYDDISATFEDYVQVVGSQPRYDRVRNHGEDTAAFAAALQDAGYATDPAYAEKITAVLNSKTMRDALTELKSAQSPPIELERTHDPEQTSL